MINWQTLTVGLCIAWAISIVVRRALALTRSPEKSGCGSGCGACLSNTTSLVPDTSAEAGFVSLESLQDAPR